MLWVLHVGGWGLQWIRPAPARLTDAWSIWDLGTLEARSASRAFYCVPLSSVCGVSGLIVLLGHQVVLMWWVGLVWLGRWWIPARHEGCQASDHIWRHHWICLIRPQDNLQPCLWRPKKVFQARTWLFPCTAQRCHNMRLKTEATETRRCNTIHINVQPRRQLSKSKCYTFCIHVVTRDWRHRLYADVLAWRRDSEQPPLIWRLTNFHRLTLWCRTNRRVYYSYIYLNSNQCSRSISRRFSFPGFPKENGSVYFVCRGLTNQYDYLCSQCSCVCTTKTPICVWDIVRDEGMKNKWVKPRRLIYCHPADLEYLACNKRKQWGESGE